MRSRSYEAVVLRAVDVGEADRFCVLFTKEAGKLAARARGVRKPGSRKGGVLLPLSHVRVQVSGREEPGTIDSATEASEVRPPSDFRAFSRAQQGIELLLTLTEDNEPLPQLFTSLLLFLAACEHPDRNPVPAFVVRALHLLGVLPLHDDDPRFARLPDDAKAALRVAARSPNPLEAEGMGDAAVRQYVKMVLADTLPRPLKAEELHI